MVDHEKIQFFRQIEYKDYPRHTVKIEETRDYLKVKEIPCIKYHYGFDYTTQNMDSNFSLLKLSNDEQFLLIYNLKPYMNDKRGEILKKQ